MTTGNSVLEYVITFISTVLCLPCCLLKLLLTFLPAGTLKAR